MVLSPEEYMESEHAQRSRDFLRKEKEIDDLLIELLLDFESHIKDLLDDRVKLYAEFTHKIDPVTSQPLDPEVATGRALFNFWNRVADMRYREERRVRRLWNSLEVE